MELTDKIKINAKKQCKHIVLPEGSDERTLRAADIVISEGIAKLTILGNVETIKKNASDWNLTHVLSQAQLIDNKTDERREKYADLMVELRKSKGMTREAAYKQLDDRLYFATMMIKAGDADGEVAGAESATGDVLRPAFQYIKTKKGASIVSSAFFLQVKDKCFGSDGLVVFADCAVNPNPNAKELAEIAVSTAQTAKTVSGIEPKVAMLSFSTKGSAHNEYTDKVVEATKLAKEMAPELKIDGELQLDAALIPEVGQRKAKGSEIAGQANIFVFPTLDAGNIGYKLVERFAHAESLGPVLQGMAAPINDLSRGCKMEDVVNLIALTAVQAAE